MNTTHPATPIAYTGIGSRQTAPDVLTLMRAIARALADRGWTLRTGGAEGADDAFLIGARDAGGRAERYLPWPRFRGHTHARLDRPTRAALELASRHHPAWPRLRPAARALLARDAHQGSAASSTVRHTGAGLLNARWQPRRPRTAQRRHRPGAADRRGHCRARRQPRRARAARLRDYVPHAQLTATRQSPCASVCCRARGPGHARDCERGRPSDAGAVRREPAERAGKSRPVTGGRSQVPPACIAPRLGCSSAPSASRASARSLADALEIPAQQLVRGNRRQPISKLLRSALGVREPEQRRDRSRMAR